MRWRLKHLSLRTEQTYWEWVVRYLKFHRDRHLIGPAATFSPSDAEKGSWRHPLEMGAAEVRAFLTDCALHRLGVLAVK